MSEPHIDKFGNVYEINDVTGQIYETLIDPNKGTKKRRMIGTIIENKEGTRTYTKPYYGENDLYEKLNAFTFNQFVIDLVDPDIVRKLYKRDEYTLKIEAFKKYAVKLTWERELRCYVRVDKFHKTTTGRKL